MPCAWKTRAMSSGVKSSLAPPEQSRDLRMMAVRHVEQKPEQQVCGFRGEVPATRADAESRSSALPSLLTSSFMTARHSRRGDKPHP